MPQSGENHGAIAGLIGLLALLALPSSAAAPAPAAAGERPAVTASPSTSAGLDLYVLVRKLSRIGARAETAFTPAQSRKLGDLLEPLFEQPELDPQQARVLLATVRRSLTHPQTAALDAIQDITPQSIMPVVSTGPASEPGPFGAPGGFPGGPGPGGPPGGLGGGPVIVGPPGGFGGDRGFGGPPGGFRGRRGGQATLSRSSPRFNPFYGGSGDPLSEQATQELRALLDALERVAPPITARSAPVRLSAAQKISVATFHYDLARTGWNRKERVLTPRNVDKEHFGRWWHTLLDGQVYAAPLVVAGARLNGRSRDLVIAPTENDSVYALDADTGALLWRQHLAIPLTDEEYDGCTNINPLHGITSTPVIDLDRKEIFVCGITRAGFSQVYQVWALDLGTGAVKNGWPVTLQGSYKGTPFDGGQLTQRGALTMLNGWLYLPFSSRCDIGEWHGWVMAVDTRSPSAPQRAFSPAPDASGGGIWGSAGLAADADGNLYAVTGNGDYNLAAGGQSVTEAILRLTAKEDLSFSYSPTDFYVPSNYEELDRSDADLGGSSAIVLDQPGSATPHLLITGGKDGLAYLVNRDNLGGIGGEIQKQRLFGSEEGRYGGSIKTTPAYFEDGKGGQYVYVTGNDKGPGGTQGVVALKLGLDGRRRSQLKTVWSAGRPLFQPGTAVVSSNGSADAIVWVIESNKPDEDSGPPGVLHAYDALTGKELYRSSQRERRDSLGDARKFSAPTVANGRVYCGTDGVVCYGPIKEEKS